MLTFLFMLEGIFETLNEMGFVVQVIVFSYLLFWLYMTFREAQLLFAVGAAVVGYLIFIHGISITILAILFLVFVIFGSHLQMIIQFGIMPLFGYHNQGDKFMRMPDTSPERMEYIQEKMAAGQRLSQNEFEAFQAGGQQGQSGMVMNQQTGLMTRRSG